MTTAATTEFVIGSHSADGSTKYTPRAMTYNGAKGYLWTKRTLENGAWVHQGKNHVRSGASENEVMCAFESNEIDHDAVDSYLDAQ